MNGNGLDEGFPRHGASVRVPVVFVGEVLVGVRHRLMSMAVRVALGHPLARRVVLVMQVVLVFVLVFHRLVRMPMRVLLAQVEPHPEGHQGACEQERRGHRFFLPQHG